MKHPGTEAWGPVKLTPDIVAVTAAALLGAIASWLAWGWLNEASFGKLNWTFNTWFDSDIDRIYEISTDRLGPAHDRNTHPLFSLLTYPSVQGLASTLDIGPPKALRLLTALAAGTWFGLLLVSLRIIGLRLPIALVFLALAGASSGAVFWVGVPETFILGSVTMIAIVVLVALRRPAIATVGVWVAAGVMTLSVTVTNFVAALIGSWRVLGWKRASIAGALALLTVSIIWVVQHHVFPTTQYFIASQSGGVMHPKSGGAAVSLRTFAFHSQVAPALRLISCRGQGKLCLSFQGSSLGSSGAVGIAATIGWAVLLGLGAWAVFAATTDVESRVVIGLILFSQATLHAVYGWETFLYAMHYVPFLILTVALGALTHLRSLVIVVALCTLMLCAWNNLAQLQSAGACFSKLTSLDKSILLKGQSAVVAQPLGVYAADVCE